MKSKLKSVRFDSDLEAKLNNEAKLLDRDFSWMIRFIAKEYFKQKSRPAKSAN